MDSADADSADSDSLGQFVVLLIGPPASGKSSQATAICKRYDFEFIDLGMDGTLHELEQKVWRSEAPLRGGVLPWTGCRSVLTAVVRKSGLVGFPWGINHFMPPAQPTLFSAWHYLAMLTCAAFRWDCFPGLQGAQQEGKRHRFCCLNPPVSRLFTVTVISRSSKNFSGLPGNIYVCSRGNLRRQLNSVGSMLG